MPAIDDSVRAAPAAARLAGHLWTVVPALFARLGLPAPAAAPWHLDVRDALHGSVRLSGLFHDEPEARTVVVVLHGLGGRASSHYCVAAARAARRAGVSCLRVSLRGADRRGEDIYHAALIEDLHAVLASPSIARHESVAVLGFSVGGHLALRLAIDGAPRLRAVAAVCPPLDLAAAAAAFDDSVSSVYRRWVMAGLKRGYRRTVQRGRGPTPWSRVRAARTIREWDSLTVVPRHGFEDADDYYARASVAPLLGDVRTPSLVVASSCDPIVPASVLRPALAAASPLVEVRWLDGAGHVGWPSRLAVEDDILTWLLDPGNGS